MLTVKTYLDKSLIPGAGIGLFASEFIPKDTIIWEFNHNLDQIFKKEMVEACNELDKDFLIKYCFVFKGDYYLCVDNSRFYNHSDDPNCYSTDYNEEYLGYTRAKRDIQAGEELTDDYHTFGFTDADRAFNAI